MSNPQLQNIKPLSKDAHLIKQAFVASLPKIVVLADYSDLELRVLAQQLKAADKRKNKK